jgi:hypothetical protein
MLELRCVSFPEIRIRSYELKVPTTYVADQVGEIDVYFAFGQTYAGTARLPVSY